MQLTGQALAKQLAPTTVPCTKGRTILKHFPNREGFVSRTFEKRSISFKIKAHEDFNHRNILNISRIKIRMQRRDWAKGGIFQRSRIRLPKGGMTMMPDTQILEVS